MITPQKSKIRPGSNEIATVSLKQRKFPMYLLQKPELEILESGFVSVNFALFGLFAGAALTLVVTAHALPKDDKYLSWFLEGAVFSGILTLYFLVVSIRDYCRSRAKIKEIKESEFETEIEYAVTEKIKQIKPRPESSQ